MHCISTMGNDIKQKTERIRTMEQQSGHAVSVLMRSLNKSVVVVIQLTAEKVEMLLPKPQEVISFGRLMAKVKSPRGSF